MYQVSQTKFICCVYDKNCGANNLGSILLLNWEIMVLLFSNQSEVVVNLREDPEIPLTGPNCTSSLAPLLGPTRQTVVVCWTDKTCN